MTFEQENNEFLKVLLTERFFKPWQEPKKDNFDQGFSIWSESCIELYLTSFCNQNCQYCYLVNNPELYPIECNNKETVLKNLKIFLDWLIENDFAIPKIELYSGEIWHMSYGLEVLEVIYQALKKGLRCKYFLIPSNVSFLRNKKQTYLIQRYINKFTKLGVLLQFSISVDGKIIEDMSRPTNNKNDIKTDEFYDNMFLFAKYNNFHFHPMVSAYSIEKWVENFKWWESKCLQYDMNVFDRLMMLEVRNDDWTTEKIQEYNKFMNFLMEKEYEAADKSAEKLTNRFYNLVCDNRKYTGYTPFIITEASTTSPCTISNHLTIRVGDLAICPCHRLAYNKFLYGHFIVEDNKIIDIKANNPQMAIRLLYTNQKDGSFGCDSCHFKSYCLRGCYGSQYENMKDPFFPVKSVCDFFEEKFKNLVVQYRKYGITDYLQTISPYHVRYNDIHKVLLFLLTTEEKYGLGKN